jgi:hypothetical protein
MTNRIKAPILAVAAVFALSGCDLLDVDNPNSLVESSIEQEAAANGVANGSLRLVADAIADIWEGPAVVSDELYWTGSRDAWGSLDRGAIGDPLNEFTDGAFPSLGQAVWMANKAVTVLEGHVTNNPGDDDFALDLARAQMFNGLALLVTGESQDDMTFSDKQQDGPAVGPSNMGGVIDDAIANLSSAIAGFQALGETDLVTAATALRARAHMSRAIWGAINPSATAGGAMAFAAALTDAQDVLDDVAGADWQYAITYASGGNSCDMCGNVNNRGENQLDASLVENTGPGATGRTGVIALLDPVTGDGDAAVGTAVAQFGDDQYADITIASARLMHLIIAEDALANGDRAEFEDRINDIRDFDGYASDFQLDNGVTDVDMLQHTRRVNTLYMGLRLQDMYRWGLTDPLWAAGSTALTNPGEMLPITIVEIRANCNLNGQGC